MKPSVLLAAFAGLTALMAAVYCYRASRVKTPKDTDINLNEWIFDSSAAMKEASRLNKIAAVWAGIAAVSGALAAAID